VSGVIVLLLILLLAACNVEPRAGSTVAPTLSLKGFSSDVSQIIVTIKGPGIDQRESFSASTEQIAIPLPPADNVLFDVEAPKKSVGDQHIRSYGQQKHADIEVGKLTNLEFVMAPYETKILIPNYGNYSTSKIIQVKDMSIAKYFPESPDFIEYSVSITNPTDVELDNYGRIWLANVDGGESPLGWISDIQDSNFHDVGFSQDVYALSFDRSNEYLYYIGEISGGDLGVFRMRVSSSIGSAPDNYSPIFHEVLGGGDVDPTFPELVRLYPFGIAVDDDGFVYVAGDDYGDPTKSYIFKIDPDSNSIVKKVNGYIPDGISASHYYYPDIMYKHGYIYVTNQDDTTGDQILQFDTDLNFVKGYGTQDSTPTQPGQFYRPSRFVATTSRKIYVLDNNPYNNYGDNRLVSFSDLDGNGWDTYTPREGSSGQDIFGFYPS